MRGALTIGLVLAPLAAVAQERAPSAGEGARVAAPAIACTCRYRGRDMAFGAEICIDGRMARCEMVLNNTSWRTTRAPCPMSAAPPVPLGRMAWLD